MAIVSMTMIGPPNSTGNYVNPVQGPNGTPGNGWQLTYTTTYANLISSQTDEILLPTNARALSVTYRYAGAATALLDIYVSNNTREELGSNSANKFYCPARASDFPQAIGGTPKGGSSPAIYTAIRGNVSGTGQTAGDIITICVKCVSRIDN